MSFEIEVPMYISLVTVRTGQYHTVVWLVFLLAETMKSLHRYVDYVGCPFHEVPRLSLDSSSSRTSISAYHKLTHIIFQILKALWLDLEIYTSRSTMYCSAFSG